MFLASAQPVGTGNIVLISDQAVLDLPVSQETLQALITFDAAYWGVSRDEVAYIVRNESNNCQDMYGDFVKGKPTSFGCAQLHNPLSKGISMAQAMSPVWSINYLAKSLANHTDHWTTQKWYEDKVALNSP